MEFEQELARILPPDTPHREHLIRKTAEHLRLVAEANEYMNLTRLTDATEAAVKHVFDAVAPWRFFAGAHHVLDAGTGAGFPGVPLALALPGVRFTLAESIQKKARFVDTAVETLGLANVEVTSERAEVIAEARRPDVIAARAVAPLPRLLELFEKAVLRGSRLLLYKGPDVENEMEGLSSRIKAEILCRYELPDGFGVRTFISVARR